MLTAWVWVTCSPSLHRLKNFLLLVLNRSSVSSTLMCPIFVLGKKTPRSYCHWSFIPPGQARHRRKDLIVKWIWLLHAFCQPWGLKEETSNGRISTHPPLPTTACTPRADIFTRVGAISNHTSTRPGCFDRKTHMKQQKPLSEKRKKAFHGPPQWVSAVQHTHSLPNHRSYQAGLRGASLFFSISNAHAAVLEFIEYFIFGK